MLGKSINFAPFAKPLMKRIAYLEHLSPWGRLLLLLSLVMIIALITSIGGLLIGKVILDMDMESLARVVTSPEGSEQVMFLKIYQVINQLGIFFIPVLIYTFLVSSSPETYLHLNNKPGLTNLLVLGMLVFTVLPFINYLGELNKQMELPAALEGLESWFREKEDQAMNLTEIFLSTDNLGGLMINLFIVAVIPALGEELLFRGALIRLFKDITGNVHWAVVISSLLFAAIHFQFYGFLPRFFLGMVLGYSFVMTRNLWVPIFIHFVNNAASVIVFYLYHNGYINIPMEDFGYSPNMVLIIGSLLISVWLMIIVYRRENNSLKSF
jgi:membrane protease YdiL (CAAX protease family)